MGGGPSGERAAPVGARAQTLRGIRPVPYSKINHCQQNNVFKYLSKIFAVSHHVEHGAKQETVCEFVENLSQEKWKPGSNTLREQKPDG